MRGITTYCIEATINNQLANPDYERAYIVEARASWTLAPDLLSLSLSLWCLASSLLIQLDLTWSRFEADTVVGNRTRQPGKQQQQQTGDGGGSGDIISSSS